jgi:hypothetical protein
VEVAAAVAWLREILRMRDPSAGQLGKTLVHRNWPLTSGFAHDSDLGPVLG